MLNEKVDTEVLTEHLSQEFRNYQQNYQRNKTESSSERCSCLINKEIKKNPEKARREIAFSGVSVFQRNDCRGIVKGEIPDDKILRLLHDRNAENRNALWHLFARSWSLKFGEGLARSWDGFVLAYQSFDPTWAKPGTVAAAFLHSVHMRCKDVRREEQAKHTQAVTLPIRSAARCVHLTPEAWECVAELPDGEKSTAAPRVAVERGRFDVQVVKDTDPNQNGLKTHDRGLYGEIL